MTAYQLCKISILPLFTLEAFLFQRFYYCTSQNSHEKINDLCLCNKDACSVEPIFHDLGARQETYSMLTMEDKKFVTRLGNFSKCFPALEGSRNNWYPFQRGTTQFVKCKKIHLAYLRQISSLFYENWNLRSKKNKLVIYVHFSAFCNKLLSR